MPQAAKTTLVLLPGMDGTGHLFCPFVDAMGDRSSAKVIAYPGVEPFGYAELESLVRSALPKNGPFVILGESFSGPIAIAIAASRPRGLVGLVLCCTFARNPRPRLRFFGFFGRTLPTAPIFVRAFSAVMFGRFSTPALREMLHQALGRVTPSVLRKRLRSVLSVDITGALADVNVPILYLLAKADAAVPAHAAKLIKSIQPQATIVELDAPHFLLQAVPRTAADIVANFIEFDCRVAQACAR